MRMMFQKVVATAMTNAGILKIAVMITKVYVKISRKPGNFDCPQIKRRTEIFSVMSVCQSVILSKGDFVGVRGPILTVQEIPLPQLPVICGGSCAQPGLKGIQTCSLQDPLLSRQVATKNMQSAIHLVWIKGKIDVNHTESLFKWTSINNIYITNYFFFLSVTLSYQCSWKAILHKHRGT